MALLELRGSNDGRRVAVVDVMRKACGIKEYEVCSAVMLSPIHLAVIDHRPVRVDLCARIPVLTSACINRWAMLRSLLRLILFVTQNDELMNYSIFDELSTNFWRTSRQISSKFVRFRQISSKFRQISSEFVNNFVKIQLLSWNRFIT